MATLVLLMLIFGVIEIARIFLVYTTITDAARQGVRYAITHGTPPAGPSTTGTATNTDVSNMQTAVQTVVQSFLAPGTVNINSAGLTITTTFPNKSCTGGTACSGTTPGNLVQVTVSYPYDLLISYYPDQRDGGGHQRGGYHMVRIAAHRKTKQGGQAVVLVILSLSIFLFGAMGLAIDGGQLYAQRQMAQAAADAAAQAGIVTIFNGSTAIGTTAYLLHVGKHNQPLHICD